MERRQMKLLNNSNNHLAYVNRGLAFMEINENQKAIDDFTKALESIPKDYKTLYFRGLVYSYIGEVTKACIDLTNSKQLGYELAGNKMLEIGCK